MVSRAAAYLRTQARSSPGRDAVSELSNEGSRGEQATYPRFGEDLWKSPLAVGGAAAGSAVAKMDDRPADGE